MADIVLRPDREIVDYLTNEIAERLAAGERVLWLIPGGSASFIALDVLKHLEGIDMSQLFITLTDERYGAPGHPNENWTQLCNAGFTVDDTRMYRVLRGDAVESTVEEFDQQLQQWLENTDYSLGLFGIGVDGHTAGIKPYSPAVTNEKGVAYFKGEDFERVTITPKVIAELDEAVAYTLGKAKFPTLHQLLTTLTPIDEQPAQALKLAKKTMLFTDYKIDSEKEGI